MKRKYRRIPRVANQIDKDAAWSGYSQPYIQTIARGVLKALKLLSVITFDPGLFFWSKGLENHLEKKMSEADQEKKEREQSTAYKF